MPRLWFRPAVLAPVLALVYALVLVLQTHNPLVIATLGARFAPADLQADVYSDEGYDGQFAYYIARSGFDSAPALDIAPYRLQRVLLPVLGWGVALGQENLLVWGLLAVNVLALGFGTWLIERWLVALRLSRWLAVGYALSVGVLGSARLLTTETLAYALVLAGIEAYRRERLGWMVLAFALASLAKETTLIFPFALCVFWLWQGAWRRAFIVGALTLLPFALWQGVLYARFGALGVGSGGALATSFEFIPLMGVLRILTEGGLNIFLVLFPLLGIFVLLPTLWGLVVTLRDPKRDIWAFWLFFNALLMLFVPFSTYREILGILRFIVGLQIAVILYAAHRRARRPLMYSTLWMMTSLLVVLSDASALSSLPAHP
jgi:hypothetical protein